MPKLKPGWQCKTIFYLGWQKLLYSNLFNLSNNTAHTKFLLKLRKNWSNQSNASPMVLSCSSSSVGLSIPSNLVGGCQFIFSFQFLLFPHFLLLFQEKLSLLLYILMPRRMRWSKKLQNIFSNFWADCCETSHETQILAYWNTGEFTPEAFI